MRPIQKNNLYLIFMMLALVSAGCEIVVDPAETGCVSCHTNKDLLKEIADPIETAEDTGEG